PPMSIGIPLRRSELPAVPTRSIASASGWWIRRTDAVAGVEPFGWWAPSWGAGAGSGTGSAADSDVVADADADSDSDSDEGATGGSVGGAVAGGAVADGAAVSGSDAAAGVSTVADRLSANCVMSFEETS